LCVVPFSSAHLYALQLGGALTQYDGLPRVGGTDDRRAGPGGGAGYLGNGDAFDRALAEFSEAYADQSEADYRVLLDAVRTRRVTVET
jgi:hypothetical protein